MYTYWDYFRNRWPRDAGWIDHLLLNAKAAARLKEAGVDKAMRGWKTKRPRARLGSAGIVPA